MILGVSTFGFRTSAVVREVLTPSTFALMIRSQKPWACILRSRYSDKTHYTPAHVTGVMISLLTAVVISIDRFPENRPQFVVYLLILLGPGTPAWC